jgi:hypothetical protein
MNSINIEVERAKKRFFVQRLQNEMTTLDKTTLRYKQLKDIYDKLTEEGTNLENVLMMASELAYAKKWTRITQYHKIQKIKEYVKEKIVDETERNKKEAELLSMVLNGKLNSSKNVIYDDKECKITKIILSKTESI